MTNDIGPPTRGARPRYLDRPLTSAERAKLFRARKAGKAAPPMAILDPLAQLRAAYAAMKASPQDATLNAVICEVRDLLGDK